MKKFVLIGLFSVSGRTAVFYEEHGVPKQFGSYQQACEFITRYRLGVHASPVEFYED